ncbi:sugar/nucleoside kinase (ribokinase family) [Friedmanniella endophytica]|uniref:Sugar/nucleoside kinase (Ribokinase family) n=1 Tax=Microlunatus kandeliicorticis TaxID=1759536 RepID=A0A7W3IQF2_9ACTN|nr:carbohydrate kinase family protein [Microlunatus kandeliicorticis]MBA8793310.1 sugar/nucleoside kinase (ribokinase family) [Microlunatus kandeliicorticis]
MSSETDAASGPRLDALFAGTVFLDLVFAQVPNPEAGTEVFARAFTISPGGAANRAVAAARLGLHTALLAELGNDPLGNTLREVLAQEVNLDISWIAQRAGFQSPVTVSLTNDADRRFVTYAEEQADLCWPASLPLVRLAQVEVAHALPHWSAALRSRGTVFYGGVGWDDTGEWSPTVLDRLAEVDVFVPNDVEAMRYTRTDRPEEAARVLGERVGLVVVTCGADGAIAYERETGELTRVPTVPVRATDPTGAGDTFVAALMASHDLGWPMEQRLSLGCLAASYSVQSLGGASSAPRPADLRRFLGQVRPPGDWAAIAAWLETVDASRPTRYEPSPGAGG